MQFNYPGAARPDPWDRSPYRILPYYQADGIGPHAATTRASYSVPAGKKALVSAITLCFRRATAPAPAGRFYIQCRIAGGDIIGQNASNDVAVQSNFNNLVIPCELYLSAGQAIAIVTGDASTGGTVDYFGSLILTEFDA